MNLRERVPVAMTLDTRVRRYLKEFGWYLVCLSIANTLDKQTGIATNESYAADPSPSNALGTLAPVADNRSDQLDLSGDRDIEWSWVAGNLPGDKGDVLDFGPSNSMSSLIAALGGGQVISLDLEVQPPSGYVHSGLTMVQGDILSYDFGTQRFDTIINCSTVEHVGIPGRYGNRAVVDGDLQAMQRMRRLMRGSNSRMIMTIPIGVDGIFPPLHRVYGAKRFPALISDYSIVRQVYFAKALPDRRWKETTRDAAFAVQGSPSFYALGLFVLAPA
jgi:hypothetical protein